MREITLEEPVEKSPWSTMLALLKHWLNFEAPLWQVAPALAVVMTVAVLVFNQFYPAERDGQAEIIAFQDSPVLHFASHETQPGIGFFSQQGANAEPFNTRFEALLTGEGPGEWQDAEHIEYFMLAPELLADQIIYAIDQPWGVSIGDITVRASGEQFVV